MRNQYNPDTVSPPGETINELLTECGMTVGQMADILGISDSKARGLIDGTTAIDEAIANGLQQCFAVPASFWLKREEIYREQTKTIAL